MNRAAIVEPMTQKICVTHKSKLGVKYLNTVQSCKFPEHVIKTSGKRNTCSISFRPIPLDVLHKIKAVVKSDVCVGSVWCSMCRIIKYSAWCAVNFQILSSIQNNCALCGDVHQEDEDTLPEIDLSSQDESDSQEDTEESSQDEYDPHTPKGDLGS